MSHTFERLGVLAAATTLTVAAMSGIGFAQEYPPGEGEDGVDVAPTATATPSPEPTETTAPADTGDTGDGPDEETASETAELAATGIDEGILAATGGAVVAAGAGALAYSRRRQAAAS